MGLMLGLGGMDPLRLFHYMRLYVVNSSQPGVE